MHAFLFIGDEISNLKTQISNLAKRLHANIFEYPLTSIDSVRNLNKLIRLSFNVPTLIVSENIHEAGEEALNAFLKNLEEPQENVYFALTAPSTRKVLPTIVSRCEILRIKNQMVGVKKYDQIENFLKMTVGEKLNYVDKIKKREDALDFAENTAKLLHSKIHENEKGEAWSTHTEMIKYSVNADNAALIAKTYTGLKANGNVNLHLVNFVINYQDE